MPDYSQFTLYATGSNPIVLNPKNINLTVNSMLGAVPALSQVTLIKENDNNRYITNYNVTTCGFTDASYSIIRNYYWSKGIYFSEGPQLHVTRFIGPTQC